MINVYYNYSRYCIRCCCELQRHRCWQPDDRDVCTPGIDIPVLGIRSSNGEHRVSIRMPLRVLLCEIRWCVRVLFCCMYLCARALRAVHVLYMSMFVLHAPRTSFHTLGWIYLYPYIGRRVYGCIGKTYMAFNCVFDLGHECIIVSVCVLFGISICKSIHMVNARVRLRVVRCVCESCVACRTACIGYMVARYTSTDMYSRTGENGGHKGKESFQTSDKRTEIHRPCFLPLPPHLISRCAHMYTWHWQACTN